jgi:anthranilate synthase component 2
MGLNVVFIDNRDSFVWNLVDAFSVLGVETKVIPNTATIEDIRLRSPDAIVISPGPGSPDDPKDIGNCIDVIHEFSRMVPILGVCLGHQAINEAFGGHTSRAHNGPVHGKTSFVRHTGTPLFEGVSNPFTGGRYHSLEISELAPPLEVIAETEDGVIMAIKHKEYPVYGVQFHPESVLMSEGLTILRNFLSLAGPEHNP